MINVKILPLILVSWGFTVPPMKRVFQARFLARTAAKIMAVNTARIKIVAESDARLGVSGSTPGCMLNKETARAIGERS